MSETRLVGYHGTDGNFERFDERFFGGDPFRAPNGALGVWVFIDESHARSAGSRVMRVEAAPTARKRLAVSDLFRLHQKAGYREDGALAFYADMRKALLEDGVQAIEVVEADGRVGMAIIVDLGCIQDVRESAPAPCPA